MVGHDYKVERTSGPHPVISEAASQSHVHRSMSQVNGGDSFGHESYVAANGTTVSSFRLTARDKTCGGRSHLRHRGPPNRSGDNDLLCKTGSSDKKKKRERVAVGNEEAREDPGERGGRMRLHPGEVARSPGKEHICEVRGRGGSHDRRRYGTVARTRNDYGRASRAADHRQRYRWRRPISLLPDACPRCYGNENMVARAAVGSEEDRENRGERGEAGKTPRPGVLVAGCQAACNSHLPESVIHCVISGVQESTGPVRKTFQAWPYPIRPSTLHRWYSMGSEQPRQSGFSIENLDLSREHMSFGLFDLFDKDPVILPAPDPP
ncbi:hypothetical protein EI94DRAFT_1913352 [Lactarius quietus]|nr:hypothetical protein EI94DRAFT_1913352 [Lactarius quietus]